MKRLWSAAGLAVVVAAAGCNRWDDYYYPYGAPYYQPPYYYQQPYAYPPVVGQPAPTYQPPAAAPCAPATTIRPGAAR